MADSDGRDDQNASDAPITDSSMHVSAVLIASSRAMMNALDALGFPEEDDRLVEQEGRLGFTTCSHEQDSDDMFALIGELAARGETWEIQFRVDVSATKAIFHTLSRHLPITALEAAVESAEDGVAGEARPLLGTHDLDTEAGVTTFRRELRRIKSADVFAEVGSSRDGRARGLVVQRSPRRLLAEATAQDEPALRTALREVVPNIMFSIGRRPAD